MELPIRFLYIKEQDLVSIQISPLVLVQVPFEILEQGFNEMKSKRDSKIISLDKS